ncbi:MAG: DUF4363 family protein [Clostridia bacterium]|nr:DUF4363 family protein [Clostridia bacterium]
MKRLVFAISALVLTAALCVFSQQNAKRSAAQFCEALDEYCAKAESGEDFGFYAEKLESLWADKREIMLYFANEDEFEEADRQVGELKYSSSPDDFRERCEKAADCVKKTAESRLFRLENIF